MKSLFLAVLAFFLSVGMAGAREDSPRVFQMTLDTTGIVSSVSTFSGTSPMLLDGGNGCLIVNSHSGVVTVDKCDGGTEDTTFSGHGFGPWYVFQIDSISLSAVPTGEDASDFDMYLEYSLDPNDWSHAQRFYVWNGETISGTTKEPKVIRIPPAGYLRSQFVTGTTSFSGVTIDCIAGVEGSFDASPPIPISHAKDAFATTGVTPFTTSFTVPAGCRCVEIQFTGADGAYSSPASSGVSRILAEDDPPMQMPVSEFNSGSYGPGAAAAGVINAQFWTDCP